MDIAACLSGQTSQISFATQNNTMTHKMASFSQFVVTFHFNNSFVLSIDGAALVQCADVHKIDVFFSPPCLSQLRDMHRCPV